MYQLKNNTMHNNIVLNNIIYRQNVSWECIYYNIKYIQVVHNLCEGTYTK